MVSVTFEHGIRVFTESPGPRMPGKSPLGTSKLKINQQEFDVRARVAGFLRQYLATPSFIVNLFNLKFDFWATDSGSFPPLPKALITTSEMIEWQKSLSPQERVSRVQLEYLAGWLVLKGDPQIIKMIETALPGIYLNDSEQAFLRAIISSCFPEGQNKRFSAGTERLQPAIFVDLYADGRRCLFDPLQPTGLEKTFNPDQNETVKAAIRSFMKAFEEPDYWQAIISRMGIVERVEKIAADVFFSASPVVKKPRRGRGKV